ncbi:phenylalanine--tRNA ligase subunit beta [Halobacteriales archaeon QS_1_68_20]|nr:MAG: phenylalanine--tRNA ligase subunit beta [Halobacteriales archaeon QS_1_68_20]
MPTVTVDPDELRRLTGHEDKDDDRLKSDLFALGLEFEGETDEGEFELEFGPDRLDRLSVEGIARSLRYQYGDDRGVYVPDTNDAEWTIEVEEVPPQRPYVTGAVARAVNLDEDALDSLIQLQEKLHATMGRGRVKGAIGIHDLTMMKGEVLEPGDESGDVETAGSKAVRYTGIPVDGDRFVPLDSDEEMTPGEVLTDHPTGDDYADIVADYDSMPAIYDEIGLFSFPPVINGRRTEVSTESRDLFVEMTGTDQWTVDKMLNVVCYALDARGARIEDVEVSYPDRGIYADSDRVDPGVTVTRPDLSTKTKTVPHDRVETVLGIDLERDEVVDLLERSGLDAEVTEVGDDVPASDASGGSSDSSDGEVTYEATIPPYRVDILHPLDVIDDVGRAYGFNDLEPRSPDISTVGGRHQRSRLEEAVRLQLVGQGFEDMLNFHLIGEADNYDRMRVSRGEAVVGGGEAATIKNPYSEDYAIVRTWALPSLLMVLENNTHRAYPQDLAEVGFAAEVDESENTGLAEWRTVAGALARTEASYEDARGHLQALARSFDVDLETPPTEHPTFIDGRAAEVVMDGESVGVVGEVHPEVLVEHDLEVPVAAFEFRLDALR